MFKTIINKNIELVTEKPKLVLLLAFIITIISIVLASTLKMDLNWVALAPKGDPAVKEYQEIIEDFPTLSNIIVLVESDDRNMLEDVSYEVAYEVEKLDEYVTSVSLGIDKDFMLKYGLLYLPKEEIEMMSYILSDPNVDSFYNMLLFSMEDALNKLDKEKLTSEEIKYNAANLDAMINLFDSTNESLSDKLNERNIKDSIEKFFTGSTIMTSPDGKMTQLTIQPNFDMMDSKKLVPGVNLIEDTLKNIDNKYDNVSVRATGMHIVARDEMASIESDSYLTTVLSIILILFILYFAFRSLLAPLLSFIPLILGIIWSMGVSRIIIGRLNMMTVFSAAMLLGLGIDYAIHMYSSYTEHRSEGLDKKASISSAISLTGPSIIIGALTTTLAFFSLNISSLELLKELGTVMGIGILTTLTSVFWILPALIMLKKEKEKKIQKIQGNYPFIGAIASGVYKKKYIIFSLLIITTIFMGIKSKEIDFDMNLMNLEPEGLESIELMNYMVEKYETSSDSFSIQVDSIDEVYRLHKEFENVNGVSEVISIASILPEKELQEERLEAIRELYEILENNIPIRSLDKDSLLVLVSELKDKIITFETKWKENNYELLSINDFKLAKTSIINLENTLKSDIDKDVISDFSNNFYNILQSTSNSMLTKKIISVNNLPNAFKSQFVSSDETKYIISVFPDFDIWSNLGKDKGNKFIKDLMEVENSITGTPIFMKGLYDKAASEVGITGIVLFIILLTVLIVHFRSIKYAILSFLPLSFTLVYMLGTMALFNISFNMLNFLAVLLIIGIGLDDGVHILHHYKEGEKNIKKLFSSVGRAILLTTITTVCGFGSLSFSSYRGIAGLGVILAIGVTFAFIMTLIVLPIFLKNIES